MSSPARFVIHVLRQQWPELGFKYTHDEVWPLLSSADLGEALLALRESDLEAYHWDTHEVWLNERGIRRLAEEWTEDVRAVLGRAFVVTLDDERIYGGLFYFEGGAAALQFPVIHPVGIPVRRLRIRPSQWETCDDPAPRVAEHCRAIADPRILGWLVHCGLAVRR